MSMPSLESELREFGHAGDPEVFRKILVETLAREYPGWSDDNLLDSPVDASDYCVTVQDAIGNWRIPDDLILRTLINTRKGGGVPRGRVDRAPHPPLARQLTEVGCGIQVEEFEAAVVQEFRRYAEVFTTETIRCVPRVARRYCQRVRALIRHPSVPDDLILRCLGNIRKRGDLPDLMGG